MPFSTLTRYTFLDLHVSDGDRVTKIRKFTGDDGRTHLLASVGDEYEENIAQYKRVVEDGKLRWRHVEDEGHFWVGGGSEE